MIKQTQRIAAIHDLSGFGRVSLTAVIPILSTMGVQVCPLPTAVLSTHSQYKNFRFIDLSDSMPRYMTHWKELSLHFDAIYSGYLGSVSQIDMVIDFIKTFNEPGQLIVIDPVLGDNGKLYSKFSATMVEEMKKLIQQASIITPNLTEACMPLGEKFSSTIDVDTLKAFSRRLSEMGPEVVVITSVPEQPDKKVTSVFAYNKRNERFWKVSCNYLPAEYPGTGDSFTSVLTGALLQGDSLPVALDRAVNFISLAVRATFGHQYDPKEGILIERVLNSLNSPVQMSSYEIIE